MNNLTTMTEEEKKAHMAKLLNKINSNTKYIIEDVTPEGYGPEENEK